MIKLNKKNFRSVSCIVILLFVCVLLPSCQLMSLMHEPISDTNTIPNESVLNEYQFSYKICETIFGIDPQTFCETKGKNTLLENGYIYAEVTANDALVIHLTDSQLESWRNSSIYLQILQKVVGDEKKIVSQIIPPTDEIYGILYKDAELCCGFEISDDYSKIISGPGDDKSYAMIIPYACLMMQILDGIPSDEILVEYLEVDLEGTVTKHVFFPMYMFIFSDLDECKQLKSYEQIPSEIQEYLDPKIDDDYNALEYESFWGMKYQSANMGYEIFAYEFIDKNNALMYYIEVTEEDSYYEEIPLNDSDKNILWQKTFGNNKYQIIVIEGNKAYKLICSNLLVDKIDELLSKVFSVKV